MANGILVLWQSKIQSTTNRLRKRSRKLDLFSRPKGAIVFICFPLKLLHFFCRICINVYEFVKQENMLICSNLLNITWNLPRWGRFLDQVYIYDQSIYVFQNLTSWNWSEEFWNKCLIYDFSYLLIDFRLATLFSSSIPL